MPFKSFYHGEPVTQWQNLDEARHKIKQTYDEADESNKAELEAKFNQKVKHLWPVSASNHLEFLTVVNEFLREASASGI